MDVTCEHCKTRYEFDAALVSSRGTTVKCTQCDHLFKVYPPSDGVAREGWTIRTATGREMCFGAMRDLQAAIHAGKVRPADTLVDGDGIARSLGEIHELERFFSESETTTKRRRRKKKTTERGLVSPASSGALPSRTGDTLRPPPSMAAPYDEALSLKPSAPRERSTPPAATIEDAPETLRRAIVPGSGDSQPPDRVAQSPPAPAAPAPPEAPPPEEAEDDPPSSVSPAPDSTTDVVDALGRAVSDAVGDEDDDEDDDEESEGTERRVESRATRSAKARAREQALRISELPPGISYPPSDPAISSIPPLTPSPSVARPSILRRSNPYTDPRFSTLGASAKPPSFARWIIGLLAVGLIGLAGFTLVKRYMPTGQPVASASAHHDTRVDKFLEAGYQHLATGNLDAAKEQFDKASGVTDIDPRVSRALATIAVIRAEQPWLHQRLLADADEELTGVRSKLEAALNKAKDAVARAKQQAPDDPASIRMQIHILRLGGDRGAARGLVGQLEGSATANALVLAALDLAEDAPSWTSVIDRLRSAVREEKKLGRAQAMLVYALIRAGQRESARRELSTLKTNTPDHSLYGPLAAFLERAPAVAAADAGVDDDADGIPADFRACLRKGHAARKKGDNARAETLYQAALDKSPGNSEALSGLADVERARGNTAGAMAKYEELLRHNPGYIPALASLADLKWSTGDRSGAVALYRQVVDGAAGSSFAEHAQQRIDSAKGTSPAPTAEPTTPPPPPTGEPPPTATAPPDPPPATTGAPTGDLPPGVDVTDLPEFHE